MTKVVTDEMCKDIRVFGDRCINAGVCDTKGKQRTYHEVVIRSMGGTVAIGDSP
jgi:hypothetical protein